MPLPRQSSYFIVAWANGVNTVHASYEAAERQIRGLRGEPGYTSLISSERQQKWQQTPARVIEVTHTSERIL